MPIDNILHDWYGEEAESDEEWEERMEQAQTDADFWYDEMKDREMEDGE